MAAKKKVEPTPAQPNIPVVDAAFIVAITLEGMVTTTAVPLNGVNPFQVQRLASTYDIFRTSKEIVADIEGHVLADRVAKSVALQLQPQDSSAEFRQKLLNALSDRGVETPALP